MLAAFLTLLSVGPAVAQTVLHTAAQMGSDPQYIDSMIGQTHVVNGLCIDLHRAIERVEPSLRIAGDQNWQPSSRIEEHLADGRLDMACAMVRTPEREKHLLFIEPRVSTLNFVLASRSNDPAQIKSWDDVRRLAPDNVVLANHGWGYVHQLDDVPGLHLDTSAYSPEVNLQKLVAGHGRFFYFREPGISEAIHRAGVAGQVHILPTVMKTADTFMAVRADLPTQTVAVLQQAMMQLASTGELAKLAARWE